MNKKSRVVEFVTIAVRESFCSVPFSRERGDYPGRDALRLAVKHGFFFEESDIETLLKFVNYYGGFVVCDIESLYCEAVGMKNIRAAISIEKYLKRKPFIFVGVSAAGWVSGRFGGPRTQRIAVGSKFNWRCDAGKEYWVECTSFAKDQESLTACFSKQDENDKKRVMKRFKITQEMLKRRRSKA